jgi:2-haloacid dehalogenase
MLCGDMSSGSPRFFAGRPTVLVFDVNETLIDIESISPLFERVFGDRRVMREWLRHLIMYSMSLTLSVSMRTSGP